MGRSRTEGGRRKRQKYIVYAISGFLAVVMMVLVFGLYSQKEREKPPEAIELSIPQEQVYQAVAGEYLCPCGACDEVFIDCHCPTALKAKKDMRKRLREGATQAELEWYLQNVYNSERKSS
ncbi:MAG TPA: hypothetical protein EYP17_07815 [Candidatus Latescibacteria bacterium]|nr:hypothetical protein [Candidatus Latescibacterota bacterium]